MSLEIPHLRFLSDDLKYLAGSLAHIEAQYIENFPWGEVSPSPRVQFKIVHDNHAVILVFDVWENETLARYTKHNQPVSKDSCVEFFVRFKGEENYYNLEFNCLGTCLVGWGPDRDNRELLPLEVIDQIKMHTKIVRKSTGEVPLINWQLTLKIPLAVFVNSNIPQLIGQKATANFYKCGDDLSQPHYMSWASINYPTPNFHQPAFFGELTFL
jgi:hypothetical protein